MNNYIVYMHIFPNNKKYIGITSKTPHKRWQNGSGYTLEKQPVMYHAIQKYGWENVEHYILKTGINRNDAIDTEKKLIKIHKTNCRRYGNLYGYNMTDGGDGKSGARHSETAKNKMSKSRLNGNFTSDRCPASRKVICDGVIYNSLTDFKRQNNVRGAVSAWLIGKKAMPVQWYNKHLMYLDVGFDVVKCQKKPHSYCIQYKDHIFDSQKDCAEYFGVSAATITRWFQNKKNKEIGINRVKK